MKTERSGPKTGWSGERGSKNQVERERSGSGKSSERERSGERAKSAAENPVHRKTTHWPRLASTVTTLAIK